VTNPTPARPLIVYFGWLIFAAFMWGSSFPAVKVIAGEFPPMTLASLRGLIGMLTLVAIFIAMREQVWPRDRAELVQWVILGAFNGWVANLLLGFALQTLPSGQAAMIQSCGPLITALVAARLFADERLTGRRIIGIGLGFCGVATLIWPKLQLGGGTPLAAFAMLGVACCYATGNIYTRAIPVADPKRLALGQQAMSALFAGVLAMLMHGPTSFAPALTYWPFVLWLGVIGTGVPILIFMYVIRAIGPTRASLTGYLVPAWAALLSALTLGEVFGLREAIAGAVILAGVYLATVKRA
jgi:drug/metabolite transporter (DMT)-like permease